MGLEEQDIDMFDNELETAEQTAQTEQVEEKRKRGRPRKGEQAEAGYKTPRDEYVRDPMGIGLRTLAKKWSMSFDTLGKQAKREGWVEQREAYQSRLQSLTDSKVQELVAENDADATARHIQILKGLQGIAAEFLSTDSRQFTSKDSAITALINSMKLERVCRGLQIGDKVVESENERDFSYTDLLAEHEKRKLEGMQSHVKSEQEIEIELLEQRLQELKMKKNAHHDEAELDSSQAYEAPMTEQAEEEYDPFDT